MKWEEIKKVMAVLGEGIMGYGDRPGFSKVDLDEVNQKRHRYFLHRLEDL